MKHVRIALYCALFLIAGFFLGQSIQPQSSLTGTAQQTATVSAKEVSFMFVFNDKKLITTKLPWRENMNLLDATKEAAAAEKLGFQTKDYGSLGVLITKIGDQTNGKGSDYWQYWVNNKQIQIAANNYVLQPNDVVNWQFRTSAD